MKKVLKLSVFIFVSFSLFFGLSALAAKNDSLPSAPLTKAVVNNPVVTPARANYKPAVKSAPVNMVSNTISNPTLNPNASVVKMPLNISVNEPGVISRLAIIPAEDVKAGLFGANVGGNTVGTLTQNDNWVLNGSSLYPYSTTWNVGIGTTNPLGKFQVAGVGDVIFNTFGYVGIGTINPQVKLNVEDSLDGTTIEILRLNNNGVGAAGSALTFYGGGTEKARISGRLNSLHFGVGSPSQEAMTITSYGTVGIGTTNPSAKLEVNGDVKASNYITGGVTGISNNNSGVPTSLTITGGLVTGISRVVGLSNTYSMKAASGANCAMTFTSGLLTASNCPTVVQAKPPIIR